MRVVQGEVVMDDRYLCPHQRQRWWESIGFRAFSVNRVCMRKQCRNRRDQIEAILRYPLRNRDLGKLELHEAQLTAVLGSDMMTLSSNEGEEE